MRGCIEMMSGAVWVGGGGRLAVCGWQIQIAEPRTVKALAPLACKADPYAGSTRLPPEVFGSHFRGVGPAEASGFRDQHRMDVRSC